jgi:hypothetical protein
MSGSHKVSSDLWDVLVEFEIGSEVKVAKLKP